MFGLLTRARALAIRIAGSRVSGHETRGTPDRFDVLRAEMEVQHRLAAERAEALERRLDRLDEALSRQGGSATERDETIQNLLSDLRARTDDALVRAYDRGVLQAMGAVRGEISALRADLAQESEERERRN